MDGQTDKHSVRDRKKNKKKFFPDLLDTLVLVLLPHLVWSHSPHLPVDPGVNTIYQALEYTDTHTQSPTDTHTVTHTHRHTNTVTHTHRHTHSHPHPQTHTHTHTHTYTHIHTQTHTNTHKHKHKQTVSLSHTYTKIYSTLSSHILLEKWWVSKK
jgi:hypothetical protein